MQVYYQDSLAKGRQIYFYNNGDYGANGMNKRDMGTAIANRVSDNPDKEFILAGHSAGADAVVYANHLGDYSDNVKGNILLEPSMEITLETGVRSTQDWASNLSPDKTALVTSSDRPKGTLVPGKTGIDGTTVPFPERNYRLLGHSELATDPLVWMYIDVSYSWMW